MRISLCANELGLSIRGSKTFLNTKSLLIATIGVLFCPKRYKQPSPSNVFLNGVRAQFFDQMKYLGVWINGSLKDDDDIQRQVKSLSVMESRDLVSVSRRVSRPVF